MRNIEIITHLKGKESNSYTLVVDGEKYLYFSEIDLLLGFIARVGSCNTIYADRPTLLNSVFNVMLGEKYTNDVDNLNQTVERLKNKYYDKIKSLDVEIKRFHDAADEFDGFKEKLDKTIETIKDMEKAYKEACVPYLEYKHRLALLETWTTNTERVVKKIEKEADDLASNSKAKKKTKKEKPAKETKEKTKTTRKKHDEEILEKAMENPNIK